MRWDELFDDLEAQLEHGLASDELDLHAEDERLRLGRLSLRDRLLALTSGGEHAPVAERRSLAVRLRAGEGLRLVIATIGRDWLVANVAGLPAAPQLLVPMVAIASVSLDRAEIAASLEPPASPRLTDRLGVAFVLRDLCRRRAHVRVSTGEDEAHGTIDRVGRDHFDLAIHEPGTERRERDIVEYRIVPFDGLLSVRL